MKTSDFDYNLPEELIAQTPVEPRDHSRLLVYNREDKSIQHLHFYDLPGFLRKGDVLVRLVSQAQMKAAQELFTGEFKKFPVDISLKLQTGAEAEISLTDGIHSVSCTGDIVQAAQNVVYFWYVRTCPEYGRLLRQASDRSRLYA